MQTDRARGFSLVELSIVLVILGLLVGGVLGGQALIKASEMKKTLSQLDTIRSSVNTFREKYQHLPGDMPWSIASRLGWVNAMGSLREGNGKIDGPGNQQEWTGFWYSLQRAGLANCECAGTNLWTYPALSTVFLPTPIPGANWVAYGGALTDGSGVTLAASSQALTKNYLEIINNNFGTVSSVISPMDSYSLDAKVDDGMPTSGSVMVFRRWQLDLVDLYWAGRAPTAGAAGSSSNVCVVNTVTPNIYNVQNSSPICTLRFEAQF